jgi:hypothetical protein
MPIFYFAKIESKLREIKGSLERKIGAAFPNYNIVSVQITPILKDPAVRVSPKLAPSDNELGRIWKQGSFRLFLSHVSAHKIGVSKFKSELNRWGIAAFVAHEDIEPTEIWRTEIELALCSMDALTALVTSDFHSGDWTDQEIGWAIGRGLLVVPMRLGSDPYGFFGKYQGISGNLESPGTLAKDVVKILLKKTQTHDAMRKALIEAFCKAPSFDCVKMLWGIIGQLKDFTDQEKELIKKARIENSQIDGTFYVPGEIDRLFGKLSRPEQSEAEDVPF